MNTPVATPERKRITSTDSPVVSPPRIIRVTSGSFLSFSFGYDDSCTNRHTLKPSYKFHCRRLISKMRKAKWASKVEQAEEKAAIVYKLPLRLGACTHNERYMIKVFEKMLDGGRTISKKARVGAGWKKFDRVSYSALNVYIRQNLLLQHRVDLRTTFALHN